MRVDSTTTIVDINPIDSECFTPTGQFNTNILYKKLLNIQKGLANTELFSRVLIYHLKYGNDEIKNKFYAFAFDLVPENDYKVESPAFIKANLILKILKKMNAEPILIQNVITERDITNNDFNVITLRYKFITIKRVLAQSPVFGTRNKGVTLKITNLLYKNNKIRDLFYDYVERLLELRNSDQPKTRSSTSVAAVLNKWGYSSKPTLMEINTIKEQDSKMFDTITCQTQNDLITLDFDTSTLLDDMCKSGYFRKICTVVVNHIMYNFDNLATANTYTIDIISINNKVNQSLFKYTAFKLMDEYIAALEYKGSADQIISARENGFILDNNFLSYLDSIIERKNEYLIEKDTSKMSIDELVKMLQLRGVEGYDPTGNIPPQTDRQLGVLMNYRFEKIVTELEYSD